MTERHTKAQKQTDTLIFGSSTTSWRKLIKSCVYLCVVISVHMIPWTRHWPYTATSSHFAIPVQLLINQSRHTIQLGCFYSKRCVRKQLAYEWCWQLKMAGRAKEALLANVFDKTWTVYWATQWEKVNTELFPYCWFNPTAQFGCLMWQIGNNPPPPWTLLGLRRSLYLHALMFD